MKNKIGKNLKTWKIATKAFFAALGICGFLTACPLTQGPISDTGGSGCSSGLTQIGVGDGFLQYLCGCTGQTSSSVLSAPANMVCHVPAGTHIIFQFIDIHTQHQIVNSGGLFFVSGAVIQPGSGVYTSAAQFTSVGTYYFEDAFNTTLQGQIVVP